MRDHNENSQCRHDCESDAICDFLCSVQLDQCIQSCPCFSQCPGGCADDCQNAICACAYPDEDPNYLICSEWVETVYEECLEGCTRGDVHCLSICGYNYNSMISQCPCQVRNFKKKVI